MLLNKHNLSIAELASKEESRYILQAIHVSAKRTAVTDGSIAVMVTLPEVDEKNFPDSRRIHPLEEPCTPR